jgi:hypothetical protein
MPRFSKLQVKAINGLLNSRNKNPVSFTAGFKPSGQTILGRAFYLDNKMVIMKKFRGRQRINNVKSFEINHGLIVNKNPLNGAPIPPQKHIWVSYHGGERKRSRGLKDEDIYEAILYGLVTDQSDKKHVRRKYHYEDIEVVVEWRPQEIEVISVWSILPTKTAGFIENVPQLWKELRHVGIQRMSVQLQTKDLVPKLMGVDDGVRNAIKLIVGYQEEARAGTQHPTMHSWVYYQTLKNIRAFLRDNTITYEYDSDNGVVKKFDVQPEENYTMILNLISKKSKLTVRQKSVLRIWGLDTKKYTWDKKEILVPDIPALEQTPPGGHNIACIYDMAKFHGNPHVWYFSRGKCKLI